MKRGKDFVLITSPIRLEVKKKNPAIQNVEQQADAN
jgi:hypothetical protein